MDIDKLQPGQELDNLIAEKVMQWISYPITDDSQLWLEQRDGFANPQWTGYASVLCDAKLPYGLTAEMCWRLDNGSIASMEMPAKKWQPSRDIAQAWRAVEKCNLLVSPMLRLPGGRQWIVGQFKGVRGVANGEARYCFVNTVSQAGQHRLPFAAQH